MSQHGHRELPGPLNLAALHEADPRRYPFLLETVTGTGPGGRYDILFADPEESVELNAGGLVMNGRWCAATRFLQQLDTCWERRRALDSSAHDAVPLAGGWFIYLSYELAAEVEPRLDLPKSHDALPRALAVYCAAAIVRDHLKKETYAVADDGDETRLSSISRDARRYGLSPTQTGPPVSTASLEQEPAERFLEGVRAAKRYIREGDVFQVNLSRGWEATLARGSSPVDLYRALRRTNPAPFACSAVWRDNAILSSSPERLVSRRAGLLETRPIAGTRPRAPGSRERDEGLSSDLLSNLKERSEHIMLVDLERNDLGRVSRAGTVKVNELMALESYAHVHHIVSSITGDSLLGVTPGQVIAAMFPGGTISGAPKVRCMEIIAEIESAGRGAYTGAVGYLGSNGNMDLNILIRTMVKHGRQVTFRAGAGIVADSDPETELDETRNKARGMLRALDTSREK